MSPDSDRIAVPTNGRGPHPISDTTPPPASPAGGPIGLIDGDPSIAMSPKQLAIGFGIIASLVLLVLGRARRRGPTDD